MKRQQPERDIHRAVVEYLERFAFPDVLWWHTPNGGKRSIQWAMQLKRLGVIPGIPDLSFLRKGNFYGMEIKAPGGRPTEDQLRIRSKIEAAGGYHTFAVGFHAAIGALKAWELVR